MVGHDAIGDDFEVTEFGNTDHYVAEYLLFLLAEEKFATDCFGHAVIDRFALRGNISASSHSSETK